MRNFNIASCTQMTFILVRYMYLCEQITNRNTEKDKKKKGKWQRQHQHYHKAYLSMLKLWFYRKQQNKLQQIKIVKNHIFFRVWLPIVASSILFDVACKKYFSFLYKKEEKMKRHLTRFKKERFWTYNIASKKYFNFSFHFRK